MGFMETKNNEAKQTWDGNGQISDIFIFNTRPNISQF